MELQSIDPARSSQLAAAGFNPTSDMPLQILFRRGGLYEYGDTSQAEFEEMMSAPRPGDVFRDKIKGRKPFRKVETQERPAEIVDSFLPPEKAPEAEAAAVVIPAAVEQKEQEVSKESTELVQQAAAIVVTDVASQEQASKILLTIASMRKKIADTWKPMKEAAFRTHRTICDKEKELDAPLAQAEKTLKERIGGYVQEQRRIAREQEEELRRQERERAEAEAQAESQRLALEDAVALEAEGKPAEAEAVLNNPVPVAAKYVPPAPVAAQVAQVKGVPTREVWKFRIVDEAKVPREYLIVNESAIGAVVSRTKGKVNIPGIEAYPEQQVAVARR